MSKAPSRAGEGIGCCRGGGGTHWSLGVCRESKQLEKCLAFMAGSCPFAAGLKGLLNCVLINRENCLKLAGYGKNIIFFLRCKVSKTGLCPTGCKISVKLLGCKSRQGFGYPGAS